MQISRTQYCILNFIQFHTLRQACCQDHIKRTRSLKKTAIATQSGGVFGGGFIDSGNFGISDETGVIGGFGDSGAGAAGACGGCGGCGS